MVQILQAKEVTLRDLISHFQLEFIEDEHFFWGMAGRPRSNL